MAIDPKTGKSVVALEDLLNDWLEACLLAARPEPPPDVQPRGESVLRGAYGPWLAAQEVRRPARGGGD